MIFQVEEKDYAFKRKCCLLEGSKISLEGLTEVKGRMIPGTAGEMLRADHEGSCKADGEHFSSSKKHVKPS